jgi:hypothetical protein
LLQAAHAAFEPPTKKLLPFLVPNPKVKPEEVEGFGAADEFSNEFPPDLFVGAEETTSGLVAPGEEGFSMLNWQSEMSSEVEVPKSFLKGLASVDGPPEVDEIVLDPSDILAARQEGFNGSVEEVDRTDRSHKRRR